MRKKYFQKPFILTAGSVFLSFLLIISLSVFAGGGGGGGKGGKGSGDPDCSLRLIRIYLINFPFTSNPQAEWQHMDYCNPIDSRFVNQTITPASSRLFTPNYLKMCHFSLGDPLNGCFNLSGAYWYNFTVQYDAGRNMCYITFQVLENRDTRISIEALSECKTNVDPSSPGKWKRVFYKQVLTISAKDTRTSYDVPMKVDNLTLDNTNNITNCM